MKKEEPDKTNASDLRKKAEKRLKQETIDIKRLSEAELRRLTHELQVHQIELDMQNEELRKAQIELEASRDKYSDLYHRAPVGYFTVSEEGIVLEANLTGADMLGIERKFLIGKPFGLFIMKEDEDAFYLQRKEVCKIKDARGTREFRMVRKDGTRFWAQLESVSANDAGVNPVGCMTIMIDITKRKQVEMSLLESEKKFESISNSANDAIIMLDNDDCVSFWNRAAEKLFGFPKEEMIGEKRGEIVMKTRYYYCAVFSILAIFLVSCSSDKEPNIQTGADELVPPEEDEVIIVREPIVPIEEEIGRPDGIPPPNLGNNPQ